MPPAKSQPAPLRVPPDPRPHRYPAPVEFPESDGEPMAESTLHRRVTIDVTTPLQDRYRGCLAWNCGSKTTGSASSTLRLALTS